MNRQRLKSAFQLWLAILVVSAIGPALAQAESPSDLLRLDIAVSQRSDPFNISNSMDKRITTIKARRGETVTISIIGNLKEGYHTYPLVKASAKQGAFLSLMRVEVPDGFTALMGIRESEPTLADEEGIGEIYEYKDQFTWEQDLLVREDAKPGKYKVPVKIKTQVCDEKGCTPVNETLEVEVEVLDTPPISVGKAVQNRIPQPENPVTANTKSGKSAPGENVESAAQGQISVSATKYQTEMNTIAQLLHFNEDAQHLQSTDLLSFLLTGIFFGAISLITPCVFPMIPITVSFFLKQSEKEHHKPMVMASVYSATIVIVLTIAAVAFLGFFRALSINPFMNIVIGGLLVFFALSLLGWYEIQLPSSLARLTSAKEGSGGMAGTIFMALTFTIISFACVAPFLGAFGGMLATGSRPLWHIILGGLAFAVTFAAPFFILALFPALLKRLPKSGSWLNSVKVVMGFLELAAAFKFFRTAELVATSTPSIFTYDLVLGIWVVLCVLCGLYLLGFYRLSHDTPVEHIGVPRMLWAVAFLALGVYLAPALLKLSPDGQNQRPRGDVYAWVDSFLLPDNSGAGGGESAETGNLAYAVAEAKKNLNRPGKPSRIFVDFTGETCTNCKLNEQNVFNKPDIKKLFGSYIVVKLYTDKVPLRYFSSEVKAGIERQWADASVNLAFQRTMFKDETLPFYAILEPQSDGKISVLGTAKGRIFQESAFAEFLRNPNGNGNLIQQAQR